MSRFETLGLGAAFLSVLGGCGGPRSDARPPVAVVQTRGVGSVAEKPPAVPPESSAKEAPADGAPAPSEPPPAPEPEYTTPLVDDTSLARLSKETCERARAAGRPILVEFSAPWCSDCLVLSKLKTRAPLAEEIAKWEWLPINVGDGDQHPDVMRAFRVKAIARLIVFAPKDCATPLRSWRPVADRTFSDVRGDHADLSRSLTAWLEQNRPR